MRKKEKRGEHTAAAATVKRRLPKKKAAYIIIALLAAALVAAAAIAIRAIAGKREYNNYMELARENFSAGEYDSALSALRKAAAVDKTDECMLLMSEYYEAQGNTDKALEILRTLNAQDPDIAARIAELEEKRDEALRAQQLEVAGKLYTADTTSLALDGQELTSAALDEVAQLRMLEALSLADNKIDDISALSALGGLVTLNLSGNAVSDLTPLSSLSTLRTLSLDGNPIKDFSPLYSMTSLTSLSLKNVEISESELDALSQALPGCAIRSELTEETQGISFGGVKFDSDVTELSLSGMGIRDISALASCEKLKKLDLSGNEISDLSPLMNLPELEELNISNNSLSDLRTLMGIDSLKYLDASGNAITGTAPLSMMNGLTELHLDNNPISDFSGLRKLIYLETLTLSATGLKDADLGYIEELEKLTALDISGNDALSGEAVDALKKVIARCEVTHSELGYSIDVGGQTVLSTATELDLSGCGISDISGIQQLPYLETLSLSKNSISNIYIFQYTQSRNTLKTLDLSDNEISDTTPLSSLQCIETLDLRNNPISSLQPLMMLSSLKTLYLGGNQLEDYQIKDLQYALPDCEIITE